MQHRKYQGAADLEKMQRLNAESVQMQESYAGYLHTGDIPHRIYNVLRKYQPEAIAHLWENTAGELLGWALIYPTAKFCGFDVQIHAKHRNDDLERELIQWAQENLVQHLKRDGIQTDSIGTDVCADDLSRARVLSEFGYQFSEKPYHLTKRSLDDLPQVTLPEGFSIRSATGLEEAAKLIEVHMGGFNSKWTVAEYEKVMQSPGYDPARELVVVAPNGQFAAFCVIHFDHLNKTGLFEPVGAHPDFRRMGLTSKLMIEGMHSMKQAGLAYAAVVHETDNQASTNLYASLGFKKIQEINYFTKAV